METSGTFCGRCLLKWWNDHLMGREEAAALQGAVETGGGRDDQPSRVGTGAPLPRSKLRPPEAGREEVAPCPALSVPVL